MKSLFALMCLTLLSSAVALAQSEDPGPTKAEPTSDQEVSNSDEGDSDSSEKETDEGETPHGEEESHSESHGEIHLENDPTHGNISDKTWALLDFRSDMALFSGAVFGLLLLGLYFSAWQPIMDGLQKREDSIANNIASAEQAAEDAEVKLAEYEQKLASANEEAATIVAEARKDAEAAGQKLVAAAQEESARLKERSTADIESAKRVALGELADQSAEVAMAVAQRVVGREVKAEDHQSLIQEMLAKLPSNN